MCNVANEMMTPTCHTDSQFNLQTIKILFSFFSSGFCHHQPAGHYTHPGNNECFIQCDEFGNAHVKPCAPGTFWSFRGSGAAHYNACVSKKSNKSSKSNNAIHKSGFSRSSSYSSKRNSYSGRKIYGGPGFGQGYH